MTGKESLSQVETDLDRARERLSFYEQFDEIIRQNIASSSALLREASARLETDTVVERHAYRTLLSDLLDDITALQAQSERIARRVSDALDDLENKLPTGSELPAHPLPAEFAASAPLETSAVIGVATGKQPERTELPQATPGVSRKPASPILPAVAPVAELPPTRPTSTTLIVHGVPRASAALGLKTHIEKLDFVTNVEPREFAAGLLRLQIESARPLTVADLSGWTLADRIESRNAGVGLLELGLRPA